MTVFLYLRKVKKITAEDEKCCWHPVGEEEVANAEGKEVEVEKEEVAVVGVVKEEVVDLHEAKEAVAEVAEVVAVDQDHHQEDHTDLLDDDTVQQTG